MRVNAGVGAYVRQLANAGQPTGVAARRTGNDGERTQPSATRRPDGFNPATFLTLSKPAQIKVTEDMLKTAIGKRLGPDLDKLKNKVAQQDGHDGNGTHEFSPDAVAGRIFDFASGLFDTYRRQNSQLNDGEAIDGFESLIRGAVQKGYDDARATLDATAPLTDDVRASIEDTMNRLKARFDPYFAELRDKVNG